MAKDKDMEKVEPATLAEIVSQLETSVKSLEKKFDKLETDWYNTDKFCRELGGNVNKLMGNWVLMDNQIKFQDEKIKEIKKALEQAKIMIDPTKEIKTVPKESTIVVQGKTVTVRS